VRTIGVVTVGRSDYGVYLPVLRRIQAEPDLRLHLLAAGMHLSPRFGLTVQAIERDGFAIGEKIEMLVASDSPEGIAKSVGLGILGFAQAYGRFRPDLLLTLGDRFEMYSAVVAALPFKIPVAHVHGGEITRGAIDDSLRHSITKLSHLHFVATQEYARRVAQLGEEPWRITVSGAPSLDNLQTLKLLSSQEIEAAYGLRLDPPPLLATFHPVTLEYEQAGWQIGEFLSALEAAAIPVVFTMPNADTGGSIIRNRISEYVRAHPSARSVENLGTHAYFSLMAQAVAMAGNSSSGLIEAPSFGLPVVNIGARQAGRVRGANVIDVEHDRASILSGIKKAIQPTFRAGLRQMQNPYGSGNAAEIIVEGLKTATLDDRLIIKKFCDVPAVPERHRGG
jgi:UDP-N-acetylglucosamine 2-epimerase (non-hydrolysing)/GDP/UDP-N,N'-diacetylbacillosamine 2-epimerase (hydrolysing)